MVAWGQSVMVVARDECLPCAVSCSVFGLLSFPPVRIACNSAHTPISLTRSSYRPRTHFRLGLFLSLLLLPPVYFPSTENVLTPSVPRLCIPASYCLFICGNKFRPILWLCSPVVTSRSSRRRVARLNWQFHTWRTRHRPYLALRDDASRLRATARRSLSSSALVLIARQ